jgi:hypothetical protein
MLIVWLRGKCCAPQLTKLGRVETHNLQSQTKLGRTEAHLEETDTRIDPLHIFEAQTEWQQAEEYKKLAKRMRLVYLLLGSTRTAGFS